MKTINNETFSTVSNILNFFISNKEEIDTFIADKEKNIEAPPMEKYKLLGEYLFVKYGIFNGVRLSAELVRNFVKLSRKGAGKLEEFATTPQNYIDINNLGIRLFSPHDLDYQVDSSNIFCSRGNYGNNWYIKFIFW